MAQPPSAAVPAPEPCVRPIPGILQFWRHHFSGPELQYEDHGQGLRDLRPHAAACRAACVRKGLQRRLPACRQRFCGQDVHARRRKRARMVQGRAEGREAAASRSYCSRFLRAGGVQEDSYHLWPERRLCRHRWSPDGFRALPLLQRHRHAGAGRLRHDGNLWSGVRELAGRQSHRHHRHADVRHHRRHRRGWRAGDQGTAGVQGVPQQP